MNCLKNERLFRKKVSEYLKTDDDAPKTFIGLAVFLGLTKTELQEIRNGKYDTEESNYSAALREADTKFEEYAESLLFTKSGGHSGIMFYLKSVYGWQDKEKEEHDDITVNISVI